MTRYTLDASYRRFGAMILGGSPMRLFRLTPAGARAATRLEADEPLDTSTRRLTDRLLDGGAIHPVPEAGGPTRADVTVVIPARNAAPSHVPTGFAAVVVDDASEPPLPERDSYRLVRRESRGGPGAARNFGLDRVTTPFVAFVDSDVLAADGWIDALLGYFADDKVALVAPRVRSSDGPSALARYERDRSAIDIGDRSGRILPGTRVAYVPAAALVVRTAAARAVGGFDPTLTTGEDVDFVWRLCRAGHRCRYVADVELEHRPRSTVAGFVRQRFGYGRSAAPLARRHPRAVAPVRFSIWSLAVWVLLAMRRPVLAAGLAAGSAAAMQRRLADLPPRVPIELVLRGHLGAGRQLVAACGRVWLPVTCVAALTSRRVRRTIVPAVVCDWLVRWWHSDRRVDPARFVALAAMDDAAYAAGVWTSAVQLGDAGALLPAITS